MAMLLLCVTLWSGGAAHAVEAGRLLSQYGHTAWRLQDGELPAPAYPMAQTVDGYLWIGTQAGVVRYDGARFVPLDSLTKSRLGNPFILALLGARDGSLWIGTTAGLSRWKDGELKDYGVVDGGVSGLAEDDNGKIWLLTHGKDATPLCEVAGDGFVCHGKDDGLVTSGVCCDRMITDGKGTFWMGTDTSLIQWHEHGSSRSFPIEAKIKAGTPGSLILAREPTGEIWAGLPMTGPGLGLQQLVGDQWRAFQAPEMAGSALAVQAMFRDRAGALWIGTIDHGIYRYADGRMDHFDSDDGLTSNGVYAFFEDREGNMWVSTSAGLDRFRDFKVWSYTTREGLSVDEVDSVLADRHGRIWAGTANSLDRLDQGQFHSLRSGKELPGTQVTALFEDRDGRLWVGIDEGLWIYASGTFTAATDANGVPVKGMAFAMAQDAAGDVWAVLRGHPSKLYRFHGDRVADEFATPRFPSVRSVASDSAGGIWLGLQNGDLARPGPGGQQVSTHLDTPVMDIAVASNGLVLGGTAKGLVVSRNGALRILSSRDGLPCDAVKGLVDGEDGTLWLSMGCGLAKVRLADVEDALSHPGRTLDVDTLDALDGVRSGTAPFQKRIARAPDGTLWIANGVSLQAFDPHADAAVRDALPVHVESLTADRRSYSLSDGMTLPPLTRDVQLDYTAIGLAVPQHVSFRYRLDGRDQDWVDAGSRRQAFYTDLPPGSYRFHVAARVGDGEWHEATAPLAFTVKPAFYQTGMFMLLVVALVAIALWLLFAWRLAHIKIQMRSLYEERHAERERIARELHDTFLQAVQGLMLRFQSAMERIPPLQPARELMEKALDHADEVIVEGRDRVGALRATQHEKASLESALRRMGEELARDSRIHFRLTIEGAPRSVEPAVADEVLRIAQESLANAFRHARADHVDVGVSYDCKHLTLSIVDDGIGFDVDAAAVPGPVGHWGLQGMHERATQLRARLTLSSRPGAGTAVELAVPAAIAFRRVPGQWRRRAAFLHMVFGGRVTGARIFDHDDAK
ncbi:sensor histidine kinase [Dyella sp. EPa41]|uniref:sensor histidine kinase n=1 Tax=Dyella sp. EPa41 TaxID=1561194 RepID=UPI0019168C27|nr:sensor histidine kinase [Dyella sp. EPa41]